MYADYKAGGSWSGISDYCLCLDILLYGPYVSRLMCPVHNFHTDVLGSSCGFLKLTLLFELHVVVIYAPLIRSLVYTLSY